ncbi:hypothetical protein [Pandoraea sp. B-6]|uniref:hypothetical protein n=1 Tax=Pandoraea sp. B-6 TaxID=1204340 RepID=UPI00038132AC|nr:hypothetical protein [Pandoraea sp. B-6]
MNRQARAIFCDDLRFELGNKQSYMGIYAGLLKVAEMPTQLAKLCIIGKCDTDVANPIRSLSFSIFLDDEVLQEQTLPEEDLARGRAAIQTDELDPITKYSVGFNVVIAPFPISKPASLRVVIKADGETFDAGRLRLRVAAPGELPGF